MKHFRKNKWLNTFKTLFPDTLGMFKVGIFYKAFNDDAYILHQLLGYKLKDGVEVGFPETSLNKVMGILEAKKISYKVLDSRNNYEVDNEMNFKDNNRYNKILEVATKNIEIENRIDAVNDRLLYMYDKNDKTLETVLSKIEEDLNEW